MSTEREGDSVATSYDRVPYASWPYANSHPNRLSTIARLMGIEPPRLDQMRVLELGCASGGNLIPMAEMFPSATFVGIDASSRQIEQGVERIETLGLENIELRTADLETVESPPTPFDFIITHGVYSWVPPSVQKAILRISHDWLSPNGVAYISYNTNPGWKMRGMIRDMLTYHCQSFEEPEERVHQARALLQFLTESAEKDTAFGTFLGEESELFNRVTDDYLFHDHLEGHNEAVYFHEFIERASGAGLQYLGEPFLGLMATRNFPDEVERTLQRVATDTIDVEQYMDFLRNRSFRMTLLVRQEHEIDRTISPERLNDLYLSAPLAPDSGDPFSLPKIFDHGERRLEALDPATSETFSLLSERWPEHIAFEEIVGEVEQRLAGWPETDWEQPDDLGAYIAEHLIHCAVASLVFIHAMSPRFTTKVTDFPRAGAWARQQASEGKRVTNQKHEIVELDDPARWLLERLDGTSSIGQLANDLRERVDSGDFEWQVDEPGDHAEAAVRAYLEEFRAGALLLPEFPESV